MRILFLGDIVGRSGRLAVINNINEIIDKRKIRIINYLKRIVPDNEKLYLIDLTGLLSNQGKATNIAIPAAITTNPKNLADKPKSGKVIALSIA